MKKMINKNSTRYYSGKQEKQIAKLTGGRVVANSGATAFNKGDITTDNILVECKTCIKEKQSFAIKKDWLDKLEEEAFAMNKPYSVLAFNYGEYTGNYFILNERTFMKFLSLLRAEGNSVNE